MKNNIRFIVLLVMVSQFSWTIGLANNDHNELGFYTDPQMSGTHVQTNGLIFFEVHMIISNPYNEDLGQPIVSTNAVEFSYSFPSNSAIVVGTYWENGSAVEFSGESSSHIVGWSEPLLTHDNTIYLGFKMLYLLTESPFGIKLGPAYIPSIPGHMAFLDPEFALHPLFPTSGSFEEPVFGVNTTVVATEQTTFDQLKAIYR